MATATVTDFTKTVTVTAATSSATVRASPQGGIFDHVDPTVYDPKNPIILFVIQAAIVIVFTRIIHIPLAKLRQPRVIAEVITGIILGPSIMGRIPHFTEHIFPSASMPAFALAANLGLVLFLFLVGLEVDLRFLVSNWRIALSVGAAGMAIPFGLGCGIAYGLYHQFRDDSGLAPISFGVYMLFIGVAMAITAFPVLCRILTTLKLLGTPVGVIVLSAGVANDVVGWILLALCVALVNSGAGLTALWILLVAIGYSLFLVYVVRPSFIYMLRRTGSLSNGPTQTVVAVTVLMVLASGFFTGVIGIHPIFGSFMVGLIMPHEGGFAVKLTEKLEDLVSVLFLPLYFALSGLSTNLGLLDNGITWGYVVGVCVIAFVGKIAGGTIASRLNGLVWRESFTIGCLMSCKGLVELIVLNIGLQAKILSQRTFTIFVVMALITTFATTPLTTWLYPPWYQRKLELWKQGKIDWDGNPLQHGDDTNEYSEADVLRKTDVAKRILVYLRLDGLPSLFTMVSMFSQKHDEGAPTAVGNDQDVMKNTEAMASVTTLRRPLQIHGLRLMELTERASSVMRVSEIEEFAGRDPIIKAFGTFGQSRALAVAGQIAVVPEQSFSATLLSRARDLRSDLVLVPWSETGTMSEYPSIFDTKPGDPLANRAFAGLAGEILEKAWETCHVGIVLDKTVLCTPDASNMDSLAQDYGGRQLLSRTVTRVSVVDQAQVQSTVHFKLADSERYRLLVLYQGSQDDLFTVRFGLQLAKNELIDLTIFSHVHGGASDDEIDVIKGSGDRTRPAAKARVEHEFDVLRASVPTALADRVTFADLDAGASGVDAVAEAVAEPSAAETFVIVGRSMAHWQSSMGTGASSTSSSRDALGPIATRLVKTIREKSLSAGLLVMQARRDDEGASAAAATVVGGNGMQTLMKKVSTISEG
ncbi:Sodium/hydrogen exchanger family-domain-containing protein [Exophiala viscosa]|uniref:Sodium/hydrogen exchanger family-domain-containing protein n=1 Tax=Exophiala viscosa TaxID=2486360 RepID=A0AAN6DPI5_9EURO|nr:Sodium/hydrogen exchanger family-domain-containing protein [Exophiala viscosa]KAI1621010.1 Sodium/hydrogen exchanger family-domain-containing protein [Exophiala viscosa]